MTDVRSMFGPTAANYATSKVHNNPAELQRLIELLQPASNERALDVATGAGNLALALAPAVASVTALDLTSEMLAQTAERAAEAGLTNVRTQLGDACKMPFGDGEFEIVALRLAAHHFPSLASFMSEAYRVLVPGGRFLLADTAVQEDPEVDREINELETLRDPSHVRSYTYSEWRKAMETAGFTVTHEDHIDEWESEVGTRMDFDMWVERINTPLENRPELRTRFLNATPAVREGLSIEVDGDRISFRLPRTTLVGVR